MILVSYSHEQNLDVMLHCFSFEVEDCLYLRKQQLAKKAERESEKD